ncbi:MAG: hypothetical protein AAGG11_16005 [Pseudomonadota bacterium]
MLLGPVDQIRVEARSVGGELLAETVTANDGSFSLPSFFTTEDSPVLLVATAGTETTYRCDSIVGCSDLAGVRYDIGEAVPFEGELRLALSSPSALAQPVALTPFSSAAADRAEVLGPLTTESVSQANREMGVLVATIADPAGTLAGIEADYYRLPAVDLSSTIPQDSPDERRALGAAVALLSTALATASTRFDGAARAAEQYTALLGQSFEETGSLEIGLQDGSGVPVDALIRVYEDWLELWRQQRELGTSLGVAFLSQINPLTIQDLLLRANAARSAFVDVEETLFSSTPIFQVRIRPDRLGLVPYDTLDLSFVTRLPDLGERVTVSSNDERLRTTLEDDDGRPLLNLFVTLSEVPEFQTELGPVELLFEDTRGLIPSQSFSVSLLYDGGSFRIGVSERESSYTERQEVAFPLSSTFPNVSTTYSAEQLTGPAVDLSVSGATLTALLPAVSEADVVSIRISAVSELGQSGSTDISFRLIPFAPIDSVDIEDEALAACLAAAAPPDGFEDVGAVQELSCPGAAISSIRGLDQLRALRRLEISGPGFVQSLQELGPLEFLDVRGQTFIPCNEIVRFREERPDLELLADPRCTTEAYFDFRSEIGDVLPSGDGARLYIGLLDRQVIKIFDLQQLRFDAQIPLPGPVSGLAESPDGERLYAALFGANAVAVIELATGAVDVLPLGPTSLVPWVSDLVAVGDNRLLVTAGDDQPGQTVLLREDSGVGTAVAVDQLLSEQPQVVLDATGTFAYVNGGRRLLKLDTRSSVPLLIADRASNRPFDLALSADGNQLITGQGILVETDVFRGSPQFSRSGPVAVSSDNRIYTVGQLNGDAAVEIWQFGADERDGVLFPRNCGADGGTINLRTGVGGLSSSDRSLFVADERELCLLLATEPVTTFEGQLIPIEDPQLRSCVRQATVDAGLSEPLALASLDCTGFPGIRSLEGLERLFRIRRLALSDSQFLSLTPFVVLFQLDELILRNDSQLGSLGPLLDNLPLTLLDLAGTDQISCDEIEALRARGVEVQSSGCAAPEVIELPGRTSEFIVDEVRNRYVVAVPEFKALHVVGRNADQFQILETVSLPGEPTSLDLAADQRTLLVGLGDVGDLGILNLATGALRTISLRDEEFPGAELFVREWQPGRVLISDSVLDAGVAKPALLVDLTDDSVSPLSRPLGLPGAPFFAVSSAGDAIYAIERSPSNAFRAVKLKGDDLSLTTVRTMTEGVLSMISGFGLSPDDRRLFLWGDGFVLETTDLSVVGRISQGAVAELIDGSLAVARVGSFPSEESSVVDSFSATTLQLLSTRTTSCTGTQLRRELRTLLADGDDLVVLGNGDFCRIQDELP